METFGGWSNVETTGFWAGGLNTAQSRGVRFRHHFSGAGMEVTVASSDSPAVPTKDANALLFALLKDVMCAADAAQAISKLSADTRSHHVRPHNLQAR